jgi:hypothetical protein
MSGSAFRRQVSVFIDRNLTPAAQSSLLARTAIEGRQDLIRTGRAPDSYRTIVDGREGVPEAQVKPQGMIVYRFNLLGEAAVFALAFLRARSPVKSGAFRESFWVAVDGRPFSQKTFDPEKVGAAKELILYNLAPYSRRVQVQFDGGRRLRFSVPPDMFGDALVAVRRRFPTLVVSQLYRIRAPGLYVLKNGRRAGKVVDSPALVIGVRA